MGGTVTRMSEQVDDSGQERGLIRVESSTPYVGVSPIRSMLGDWMLAQAWLQMLKFQSDVEAIERMEGVTPFEARKIAEAFLESDD